MGFLDADESPRFSSRAEAEIEGSFRNAAEAHDLLALIDAEFQSDPASVQCFDLRIVQRVRECVRKQKGFGGIAQSGSAAGS